MESSETSHTGEEIENLFRPLTQREATKGGTHANIRLNEKGFIKLKVNHYNKTKQQIKVIIFLEMSTSSVCKAGCLAVNVMCCCSNVNVLKQYESNQTQPKIPSPNPSTLRL